MDLLASVMDLLASLRIYNSEWCVAAGDISAGHFAAAAGGRPGLQERDGGGQGADARGLPPSLLPGAGRIHAGCVDNPFSAFQLLLNP